MLTLCIDTAYKYLTCALIKDDELIAGFSKECFKKQSEEVFVALGEIFRQAGIDKKDIDSICISRGPGSYTGVRIAMTIAKVMAEIIPCDLYTISTMRLYAANREKCMVIMDARANRVYCGIYDKDQIIMEDRAIALNEIDPEGYEVIGDGSLVGRNDDYGDILDAFVKTKHLWNKVDNIAHLTPDYLKESESYYR